MIFAFFTGLLTGFIVSFVLYQRKIKSQRETIHGKNMVISSLQLHYNPAEDKKED